MYYVGVALRVHLAVLHSCLTVLLIMCLFCDVPQVYTIPLQP